MRTALVEREFLAWQPVASQSLAVSCHVCRFRQSKPNCGNKLQIFIHCIYNIQSLANMFPNMATIFWPCWCRSNQRSKVVIFCGPLDLYIAVDLLPMHSLHPKHTFGSTHSQRPPCDDFGCLTTRQGQIKISTSSRIMWLPPGEFGVGVN